TKLSAWLANGSLSAREVIRQVQQFEATVEKNDSTYWIYFELLWREFFHWLQCKYGANWFRFSGIQGKKPSTQHCPETFALWCEGKTGYPIVDACMRQLAETGYMSNRGRQLVASCFVHELRQDWRYGAAWFEHQLIDYDVGSNWGNWLYLAGVGSDPRGHRQFNLQKQTEIYDSDGQFRKKWL
ncbi:MAG: FAD-binding domain-containing protein, partial [Alteromonas macleodii]|nr:FAD-binding domain-containing protein [Alteromonas macleodii]